MIGPFINSAAIIAGGALGALLKNIIPERIEKGLVSTFGLIAVSIGITMVIKVHFLPAVVLALIFGIIIGELFSLEKGIENGINKGAGFIQSRLKNRFASSSDRLKGENPSVALQSDFAGRFSALIVLFTFSGMGFLGSLTEGLSGDPELLLIKSILDFFTAMIFAMTLGPAVMLIFITQLALQSSLFFLAKVITPYMDQPAYGDFSACGGVIMLAIGLRIARIKDFNVVNFLPALALVIPFSYLWRYFFPV